MKRLMLIAAAILTLALTTAPAVAQYGGSQGFLIDPAEGHSGDQINFLGAACGASETIVFTVKETGIEIARTTTAADPDGSFFVEGATIPDLPPGTYTIEATCLTSGRVLSATLTVLAVSGPRGPLALTGNREPRPWLRTGIVLVAIGAVLVLAIRRRRGEEDETAVP